MRKNVPLTNFANGETSPLMAARVDDPAYNQSLSWCQNYIPLPQGGLRYRPGSYACGIANANGLAYLIPFQFSANDAIVIEATDSTFRFYRNGGLVLNTPTVITAITQANPGIVTAVAHGLTTGQEVFISGVWGMPQVNDRYFLVTVIDANHFSLQDQFGNNVNTAAYSAYTANGTVASVYTVSTPYSIVDIPLLRWAQTADIVYFVHPLYAPYKLTRLAFTTWTMSTFSRTNDPFGQTAPVNISNVSRATPTVVTVSSTAGFNNGDSVLLKHINGPSGLNNKTYIIQGLTGTTFQLYHSDGTPVTTATNYISGGTAQDVTADNWPACVAFTSDGRLAYANSTLNPMGLWASELPGTVSGGVYTPGTQTNYDNFSTGTPANDAYSYQFAPINGEVDAIQELKPFGGMLALLGATAVQQAYGASAGTPPNPDAIGTFCTIGGSAKVQPLGINQNLLFVDVNGKKLRGLQFNFYYSTYSELDYNINSSHFGDEAQFIKIVHMKGIPEIVWCLRADGVLLSFTFSNFDPTNPLGYKGAWARHYVGAGGSVTDICSIRDSNGDDQLYLSVQRTITGQVYNTIELLDQWPDIPLQRSFFTGNKTSDQTNWALATWEKLKRSTFLDMSLTYDGTERGNQAQATITPSATAGNAITLTASAAVFQPSDVGSQLWKFYAADGSGGGQVEITGYTSNTQVTANVLTAFDSTNAIPAGSWAFAVNQVVNLQLLAGQTVSVQADGGGHPQVVVSNIGAAFLQQFVSKAQFGFNFVGMAATLNLDFGAALGAGGSKPRNVKRIKARVDNTMDCQIGTTEYDVIPIIDQSVNQIPNMPCVPFTGSVDTILLDTWSEDVKEAVILHQSPVPCTVLGFDIEMDTNEHP